MAATGREAPSDVPFRLLSPQDVADMLVIPVSTLYHWRYKRKGPKSFRLGKHVRYRMSDVLEWLEEQS